MKPKAEITIGNLLSVGVQLTSLVALIVTITLAYGKLQSEDEVLKLRVATVEQQLAKREATEAATINRLSQIEGDIRVIRQILEGARIQPPR